MSRSLDWKKAKDSKIAGEAIAAERHEASARQDKYFNYKQNVSNEIKLVEQGIWPTGKHAGTKIKDLTEKYLVWAGLNLKSKHLKHAANNELIRRYNAGQLSIS